MRQHSRFAFEQGKKGAFPIGASISGWNVSLYCCRQAVQHKYEADSERASSLIV